MSADALAELLATARDGDRQGLDRAFAAVYRELRQLAHRHRLRSRPGDTLSTTVLVHEVFLKLAAGRRVELREKRQFFALAGRAMRQILVDAARSRGAAKRGGSAVVLTLEERDAAGVDALTVCGPELVPVEDLLALHAALERLERVDERLARLVEARFFAGLTDAELAALLERNERTVRRDWERARAFLLREMNAPAAASNPDPDPPS